MGELILNRLLLATVELAALALLMVIVLRTIRIPSPRVLALLWLIILLKPLVSLAAGSPYGFVVLEVETTAMATSADASTAAETTARDVGPVREPLTARGDGGRGREVGVTAHRLSSEIHRTGEPLPASGSQNPHAAFSAPGNA